MPSTTYYWDEDDDNVCCEEDENGEITASYTHEPGLYGELIAQKRGDEVRYSNFDGEGNTCELTDEDENVTDTYEYSAFGEEVARTGTTENPFGYKGALGYYTNGETNDIYVRARNYRSPTGRWNSCDPLGFHDMTGVALVLKGLNLYSYVGSDPLNADDPSGEIVVTRTRPLASDPTCNSRPEVGWEFRLSGPNTCRGKGWIVQQVYVFCSIVSCAACNTKFSSPSTQIYSYLEAWEIPYDPRNPLAIPPAIPDTARLRVPDNSCGHKSQKTSIRFYCDRDMRPPGPWKRDPNQRFGTGLCATSPGNLWAMSTTAPNRAPFWYWTGYSKAEGNGGRAFLVDFTCCPCVPEKVLSSVGEWDGLPE